uniref:PH domain-containing protein n=1 Tax=Latimeria chalumnae TaxID=7897 RepID=H2ZYP5_LATCH
VLSHNLCTVLNIPHDPKALEDHFSDDNDGPVSNQGYMPYLHSYILDKVQEGNFEKEAFDELCWMLSSKKHYKQKEGSDTISRKDAFKLWCLFIFLSEDKYPLIMVPEEVEYLLKKFTSAMGLEWHQGELEDFYFQDPSLANGMQVWSLLDLIDSGIFSNFASKEVLSLAINDVFLEIYHDVLKKGYVWKKGHRRRNWSERWFVLQPTCISYYVSEDLKEKKGEVRFDKDTIVEVLSDRDGRRCLFCIKTATRSYEVSASDLRHRQEWMQAIQMAIRLMLTKTVSYHKDLKVERRGQREQNQQKAAEKQKERDLLQLQKLQEEKERQIKQIEEMKRIHEETEVLRQKEEKHKLKEQEKMQQALETQLREAEEARAIMEAEMAQKEIVAQRQQERIKELEKMKQGLETALDVEIHARYVEENARLAQARLLEEEEEKLKQLMHLQAEQEELIMQAQQEKEVLQQEITTKAQDLDQAFRELEELRESRQRNDQDLAEAEKQLRHASHHVKHWNVQLNRLMQPIMPGGK